MSVHVVATTMAFTSIINAKKPHLSITKQTKPQMWSFDSCRVNGAASSRVSVAFVVYQKLFVDSLGYVDVCESVLFRKKLCRPRESQLTAKTS